MFFGGQRMDPRMMQMMQQRMMMQQQGQMPGAGQMPMQKQQVGTPGNPFVSPQRPEYMVQQPMQRPMGGMNAQIAQRPSMMPRRPTMPRQPARSPFSMAGKVPFGSRRTY